MEELQDPRLAERTRNGESRSTRGCGARPGSSAAVRMGDYTEIFGGVDSSCSIPVLVLPETMDCYGEELDGSQTLNYSEIFGGFDTGKFTLSYEELVSREKGLTEEDNDRFQEETSIGHVETGASMLHTEDPVKYHIAFTKVNQVASTVHSNLMEAKNNIPQYNYGLNFEAETVSSTGYMEDQSSNHVESDDLILFRRMEDDEERRKKTENKCFIGVIEDDSDNDDSTYHSTSSGDTPFSDYAFLTISDINLHTEPLHVPPPSRAPPVLDMKQEESTLETALDKGQIPEIYRSFHSHCVGGSRTRHTLKEAVKANSFVEVDASSAAAASAAAMIEAMEQAQASLKSAKELMERKRDGSHDFSSVNGHRSNLVGKSKHKTKMSQCVENSAFSVDTEEEMQRNGSIFIPSTDKNEKSHEWMIDKQFSELVGNGKLMGNRVISNEMYNSNEAVRLVQHPSTNQFFPGKEVFGKERTILSQGDSGNEVKMLNRHALSEKTLDIIDTSAIPYFQGDVEAKQKVDPALQDCTVSLIQPHKNDNGLKKCERNNAQNGDKYIENDNKIHNAGERNDTGFMDFYCDRKLDEFNGDKPIWKTLGQGMEYDKPNETSKVSEYDELSTYERMKHSRNVYHSTITCDSTLNKKFDAKLSNLFNSDEVFEKKLEDLGEEFEVNESFIEARKLLKASVRSERNGAVCEPPNKFELHAGKPTVDGEQMKVENNLLGKVQAALELENKIKGLNVNQQVFDGDKVQEVDKNAKFLSSCVEAPSNSMKRMEKIIPDDWTDIGYSRKIEERVREREKDRIFVQKTTCESCAKDFVEAREKPERTAVERVVVGSRYKPINDIAEMPSVEVFEKHEKVANEAKLRAERAAVERATTEARERAIERALAEQASIEAKRQGNALNNFNIDIKPNSNNHGAPIHLKSQTVGREIESPLRCKARQERNQRIVERTAKALAEKNMRDLLAHREQVERNRIAESLDAEVRRWSNGKDGNLRALLSTLHYILGNDSGWQPIPLTEVLTAAAVRKAYRKATLYVHPDKLQQRGASIHHKYTCEKVFDLLKDAWNKFNSEG